MFVTKHKQTEKCAVNRILVEREWGEMLSCVLHSGIITQGLAKHQQQTLSRLIDNINANKKTTTTCFLRTRSSFRSVLSICLDLCLCSISSGLPRKRKKYENKSSKHRIQMQVRPLLFRVLPLPARLLPAAIFCDILQKCHFLPCAIISSDNNENIVISLFLLIYLFHF